MQITLRMWILLRSPDTNPSSEENAITNPTPFLNQNLLPELNLLVARMGFLRENVVNTGVNATPPTCTLFRPASTRSKSCGIVGTGMIFSLTVKLELEVES
jgi:hypothetical protein